MLKTAALPASNLDRYFLISKLFSILEIDFSSS